MVIELLTSLTEKMNTEAFTEIPLNDKHLEQFRDCSFQKVPLVRHTRDFFKSTRQAGYWSFNQNKSTQLKEQYCLERDGFLLDVKVQVHDLKQPIVDPIKHPDTPLNYVDMMRQLRSVQVMVHHLAADLISSIFTHYSKDCVYRIDAESGEYEFAIYDGRTRSSVEVQLYPC